LRLASAKLFIFLLTPACQRLERSDWRARQENEPKEGCALSVLSGFTLGSSYAFKYFLRFHVQERLNAFYLNSPSYLE